MTLSRIRPVLTILAIAITAPLLVTTALADRGQIAASEAVLTSMYGDVQVRHGAGGYAPAKLNEVLKPNDGVRTGASSRAEISVANGGYVRMDENSQLLITGLDSGGTTSFQALAGGLWVTIEKALGGSGKFEVRMPSAVASVKGTVFRCTVDEDGTSETYVYEGAVDVEAGERRFEVTPDRRFRGGRNTPGVVDSFSLSQDDEAAWVMYNRHRDIIKHLGDPTISVALREHQMPEAGVFATSKAIAGQLALHGLRSTSIADLADGEFEFREDGSIDWRRTPLSDYCVIGDVTLEQLRQVDGTWSAIVAGDISLVRDGESEAMTSIDVRVPGAGHDAKQAAENALAGLGKRVGSGLAPRIIRELMQAKAGTVRVDISGGNRESVAELRRAIVSTQGVLRTAPLVLPGNRISLAVITDLSADQVAQVIQQRAGDRIERVLAGGEIVFVRLPRADAGLQSGQMNRPLEDRADWMQQQMGAGQQQAQPPQRPRQPRPRQRPMHR